MLIGRVGKEPEIRTFNDTKKASFSLATSENWKDKDGNKKESTEWHLIVCWSNMAKIVESYVKKGDLLYIEGKLTTRSWDDKDGIKHYATEIVASNLQMLGGKEKAEAPPSNVDYKEDSMMTPSQSADIDDSGDLPF